MQIRWISIVSLGAALLLASPAVAAAPDTGENFGVLTMVGKVSRIDVSDRKIKLGKDEFHVPARVRGLDEVRHGAIVTLDYEEVDGEWVVKSIRLGDKPELVK